tara:strand:- start:6768 stop:7103 length:336 start_codon:yes stop_codon:yes gene_type:complete
MISSVPIKEARRILHDTDSPYRWPDSQLIGYLNQAQYDLRHKRLEFWLDSSGAFQDTVIAINLNTEILLEDRLSDKLASFIVFKALSEDDADTENLNRAAIHKALYEELTR